MQCQKFDMNKLTPFAFGVKAEREVFTDCKDGCFRLTFRKGFRDTSANINRLKKSLKEKDLIDSPRANCIELSDPILKLWLKKRIL